MIVSLIHFLIEHDPVPGFQMHFDGTHLLGNVLARALYQSLSQVGGKLRPGIGGDVDAAPQRAAHVGGDLPDSVHLHRVGYEDAGLSIRVIDRKLHGIIVPSCSSEVISMASRSP